MPAATATPMCEDAATAWGQGGSQSVATWVVVQLTRHLPMVEWACPRTGLGAISSSQLGVGSWMCSQTSTPQAAMRTCVCAWNSSILLIRSRPFHCDVYQKTVGVVVPAAALRDRTMAVPAATGKGGTPRCTQVVRPQPEVADGTAVAHAPGSAVGGAGGAAGGAAGRLWAAAHDHGRLRQRPPAGANPLSTAPPMPSGCPLGF